MKNKVLRLITVGLFVILFSFTQSVNAQADTVQTVKYSRTSIFIEASRTSRFSFNVDQRVSEHFSIRGGVGLVPLIFFPGFITLVPLVFHYLEGGERSFLEVGLGTILAFGNERADFAPIYSISYRFQSKYNGFFFRAGFSGLIEFSGNLFIAPRPGFGLGYTFRN